MKYYKEDQIQNLRDNEVFVFGSNLAGRHGAGAAKTARLRFKAEYGVGVGTTGQCYAIPTKDQELYSLSLFSIKQYVYFFIKYAKEHPESVFLVTRVGCGLAGYTDAQIAPIFKDAPDNCWFHKDWFEYLEGNA